MLDNFQSPKREVCHLITEKVANYPAIKKPLTGLSKSKRKYHF